MEYCASKHLDSGIFHPIDLTSSISTLLDKKNNFPYLRISAVMDPHCFFKPTYFCILYFFYLLFSTLKTYLFVDILAFNMLHYKPCVHMDLSTMYVHVHIMYVYYCPTTIKKSSLSNTIVCCASWARDVNFSKELGLSRLKIIVSL